MIRAICDVPLTLHPNGNFSALNNIEVFSQNRREGRGVLKKLLVPSWIRSKNLSLHVVDIQPTAVGFWDKMGAKFLPSEGYVDAHLTSKQSCRTYDARGSIQHREMVKREIELSRNRALTSEDVESIDQMIVAAEAEVASAKRKSIK